jgi:hypothetical protein
MILGGAMAAVIVALSPDAKTFLLAAIIVSLPPTITGLFGLRKLNKIEINTNHANTMLREQRNEAATRADVAEGAEAGRLIARAEATADAAKKE